MIQPEALYRTPNVLSPRYSRFGVTSRILLTGHSHQAWPDVGFEAQQQAWLDAAQYVDDKWERAFAQGDRVRKGFAHLLGDRTGDYALGGSTHEMVIRFLSALPLKTRPRIVTTDGEFHTLRRQLDRLSEESVEVVKIPHVPVATVSERLAAAVNDRTAAVMVSSVFYDNGQIVHGLDQVQRQCERFGAQLLVDMYHALNVVPVSLEQEGLDRAFVTGGGYKYCQLGEGNCFLRIPPDCTLRPVVTGWFAEFDALAGAEHGGRVPYGKGAARFAGATYDPTSHYRAARVFDFFAEERVTPELLREVSQHQVGLLAKCFDSLDTDRRTISRDRTVPLDQIGGFLTLKSPRAGELSRTLRKRDVWTDYRGEALRLGPAPYLSDVQLSAGVAALGEVLKA